MIDKICLLAQKEIFDKKRFSKLCTRATAIAFLLFLLPSLLSATQSYIEKLHEFAHRMPKATLHIHLEGSIAPQTVIDMAKRNGVAIPFENEEQFREMCNFSSFDDFVKLYRIIQSCLKTPDDFEQIAYEYGKESGRQNILYSEVMVSLDSDWLGSGLDWKTVVEALNKGRQRAQDEFDISWTWIFANAHPETVSPDDFVNILKQLHNNRDDLVAMAVLEPLFNEPLPVEYQCAYNNAIAHHLPVIPHSGEFKGPQNIINALHALDACKDMRIDHGVQCIQDENLMRELAQKQVPLDVCITSNVRLHAFPDYAHHPIRELFDAGLFLTINTDDPALFNIDLNSEYDHLIDDYHFSIDELEKISMNGILASLLPPRLKMIFEKIFEYQCATLREEIFGG